MLHAKSPTGTVTPDAPEREDDETADVELAPADVVEFGPIVVAT